MELILKKYNSSLVPADNFQQDEFDKLKAGQEFKVSVKKERNLQFHKKFFALVKIGHENTKLQMPLDSYRKYITVKAGYFNRFKTHTGTYIEPVSIAFNKMDDVEFEEVYNRVLDAIINDIGADKQLIEQELLSFL